METIQNQINQALLALPIILWWLAATGLVNLVAHRSQVDAWCEKRPRLAAMLKVLRGVGFDPWLLIQGLSLAVVGRLPAKLRDTIPVLLVSALAVLLSGCAAEWGIDAEDGACLDLCETASPGLCPALAAQQTTCAEVDQATECGK